MKTLFWMAGFLAVLALGLLLKTSLDPASRIVGVSNQHGRGYDSWTVLLRDGTFEQLIRDPGTRQVVHNRGQWVDAANDPNSQLFMAQTGIKTSEPYLDLKNKVEPSQMNSGKSSSPPTKYTSSLIPASSFHPPTEKDLRDIAALRSEVAKNLQP